MCFPPPAPLWNATSFLLLRPPFVSPLPPRGTGHPSFSCCPGSVYIQLYRHNDMCFPPPAPLWNATSFLLLFRFPPSPRGTGHPSFSCGPGSVEIQLYRHNDMCFPPPTPLWNATSFLLLFHFPPPPPVERDILPFPAALVQLKYNYIGITIDVSPLPPPLVERDILPGPSPAVRVFPPPPSPPCGTGRPSFSCGPFSHTII